MNVHGKLIFKQLTLDHVPAVEKLCEECVELGYVNNSSLTSMKFFSATFFGAFDQYRLVSVAGVHQLPEINEYAWRCLFRGVQLPGYTPEWSMDIFKSSIHFSQLLYRQIQYVSSIASNPEFFISTNLSTNTGAKSSRMNDVIMPRIVKRGMCDLYLKNFELYNTPQNLWKVNVDTYIKYRSQYLE